MHPDQPFKIVHSHRSAHFTMPINHVHDFFEVYYLQSGQRHYFIQDNTYLIHAGDLVLIDKYELHRTLQAHGKEHERLVFYFRDEWLFAGLDDAERESLLSVFRGKKVISFPLKERFELESLMNKMLKESQEKQEGCNIFLKALVLELLVLVKRVLMASGPVHEPVSAVASHGKIAPVVEYINKHYKEPITLNSLAELFYISPFHLSRLFKKSTGFNLIEYVQLIRVKEAQKLLGGSRKRMVEIALQVGFNNTIHFARTFKKIVKLSPKEYSMRQRNSSRPSGHETYP